MSHLADRIARSELPFGDRRRGVRRDGRSDDLVGTWVAIGVGLFVQSKEVPKKTLGDLSSKEQTLLQVRCRGLDEGRKRLKT